MESLRNKKYLLNSQQMNNILGGDYVKTCDGSLREEIASLRQNCVTLPDGRIVSVRFYGPTQGELKNNPDLAGKAITNCEDPASC